MNMKNSHRGSARRFFFEAIVLIVISYYSRPLNKIRSFFKVNTYFKRVSNFHHHFDQHLGDFSSTFAQDLCDAGSTKTQTNRNYNKLRAISRRKMFSKFQYFQMKQYKSLILTLSLWINSQNTPAPSNSFSKDKEFSTQKKGSPFIDHRLLACSFVNWLYAQIISLHDIVLHT